MRGPIRFFGYVFLIFGLFGLVAMAIMFFGITKGFPTPAAAVIGLTVGPVSGMIFGGIILLLCAIDAKLERIAAAAERAPASQGR